MLESNQEANSHTFVVKICIYEIIKQKRIIIIIIIIIIREEKKKKRNETEKQSRKVNNYQYNDKKDNFPT